MMMMYVMTFDSHALRRAVVSAPWPSNVPRPLELVVQDPASLGTPNYACTLRGGGMKVHVHAGTPEGAVRGAGRAWAEHVMRERAPVERLAAVAAVVDYLHRRLSN